MPTFSKHEIESLALMPLADIMGIARRIKLVNRNTSFSLCTITNARSGKCTEDCAFCAQSARHASRSPEYGLKPVDQLVREASNAQKTGATRFSLVTSGRGIESMRQAEEIAERIAAIREQTGISVCASLGIARCEHLEILKQAGLSRYHHNLETSRDFFPSICTTHTFDQRVNTIRAARKAGLEVCAGGLIGLGESREQRLSLGRTLAELAVDSVPVNILVPIKGTPLEGPPRISIPEILRTIAIFRILMPSIPIRLAGGRDSILKDFQGMAFNAGADAMLIGGYLTVRGRAVEEDLAMVEEIRKIWSEECGGGLFSEE